MIEYVSGNVFDSNWQVLAHGVNCQGVMGSGVAKQIRERFPYVYGVYLEAFRRGLLSLGRTLPVPVGDRKWILNLATQYNFLPRGLDHFSYDTWPSHVQRIEDWCVKQGVEAIHMPKIGAGLAGGNWERISVPLDQSSTLFRVYIL